MKNSVPKGISTQSAKGSVVGLAAQGIKGVVKVSVAPLALSGIGIPLAVSLLVVAELLKAFEKRREFLLLFQDCDFILGRCSLMLQYNIQILNAYYHFLEENPTLCILNDDEEIKDIHNRLENFKNSDEESIKNEYVEQFRSMTKDENFKKVNHHFPFIMFNNEEMMPSESGVIERITTYLNFFNEYCKRILPKRKQKGGKSSYSNTKIKIPNTAKPGNTITFDVDLANQAKLIVPNGAESGNTINIKVPNKVNVVTKKRKNTEKKAKNTEKAKNMKKKSKKKKTQKFMKNIRGALSDVNQFRKILFNAGKYKSEIIKHITIVNAYFIILNNKIEKIVSYVKDVISMNPEFVYTSGSKEELFSRLYGIYKGNKLSFTQFISDDVEALDKAKQTTIDSIPEKELEEELSKTPPTLEEEKKGGKKRSKKRINLNAFS